MKRKNYKCVECGFTCYIQNPNPAEEDGDSIIPLPQKARDHLWWSEHAGFEPI